MGQGLQLAAPPSALQGTAPGVSSLVIDVKCGGAPTSLASLNAKYNLIGSENKQKGTNYTACKA